MTRVCFTFISRQQSDFAISRGFYFHETLHVFRENKTLAKFPNLQYLLWNSAVTMSQNGDIFCFLIGNLLLQNWGKKILFAIWIMTQYRPLKQAKKKHCHVIFSEEQHGPYFSFIFSNNSNSLFLSFFWRFYWSVGKIKWFLHFNKNPWV